MAPDSSNAGVPPEFVKLVSEWRRRGSPPQQGTLWVRERWMAAFPRYASMLAELPELLDRGAVRRACSDAAASPERAIAAFLSVMAWGYGKNGYGAWRAQKATAPPLAAEHLRSAVATLKESGPPAGYGSLAAHRLPRFGPVFGTKFLAFCSPESHEPALILDRLVADQLERHARERMNVNVWCVRTYERYLRLMYDWASKLQLEPEALELCIFSAEARRLGNQFA